MARKAHAQVIYHGHSNLEIVHGEHTIQLDPFYTDNELADIKAEAARPQFILISHAHFDHLGDAEQIARRTGATIISNFEITQHAQKNGVQNVHGMNLGGGHAFPFGRLTMTLAFHTSSFQDGTYGGEPAGFMIELTGGPTIYFAGDTALFGDMKLIGKLWKIDLACLPIGDNFTMSAEHAVLAAEMLKAKAVLPIHYNTFPPIREDPAVFVRRLKKKTGIKGIVLEPGGTLEL